MRPLQGEGGPPFPRDHETHQTAGDNRTTPNCGIPRLRCTVHTKSISSSNLKRTPIVFVAAVVQSPLNMFAIFFVHALVVGGGSTDDARLSPKRTEAQGAAVRRSLLQVPDAAEEVGRKQEPQKELEECDDGAEGVVAPAADGTAVLSGRVVAPESTPRAAELPPLG